MERKAQLIIGVVVFGIGVALVVTRDDTKARIIGYADVFLGYLNIWLSSCPPR